MKKFKHLLAIALFLVTPLFANEVEDQARNPSGIFPMSPDEYLQRAKERNEAEIKDKQRVTQYTSKWVRLSFRHSKDGKIKYVYCNDVCVEIRKLSDNGRTSVYDGDLVLLYEMPDPGPNPIMRHGKTRACVTYGTSSWKFLTPEELDNLRSKPKCDLEENVLERTLVHLTDSVSPVWKEYSNIEGWCAGKGRFSRVDVKTYTVLPEDHWSLPKVTEQKKSDPTDMRTELERLKKEIEDLKKK